MRSCNVALPVALWAPPGDFFRLVLRQSLVIIGIGLLVGLATAFAGTRVLADLFVGVRPSDPVTYSLVALLLLSVALFACWVPARRATRVSPTVALLFE